MDNDTRRVDYVQLGTVDAIDTGTRGTYYFDAFVSRRETYIGEASLLDTGFVRVAHRVAAKVLAAPVSILAAPAVTSASQTKNLTEQPYTYTPVTSQPVPVHFTPVNSPPEIPLAAQGQPVTTTITYTYDALYRMKQASYSDGTLLKYTYDAVGNRLTEELSGGIVNAYVYDTANRMTSVDGISYTWDANGNLLSDGARSYTYDHANRLVGVSGVGQSVSYSYNGLGDRLQQTVNSVTTQYSLDLNAGLTQVLADGTNTYLYGVNRIAQYDASSPQYFLGDALGSVRQLVDASGNVTLAKSYQPYGEALAAAGEGATNYGFTNEWTDTTGLVNLRSRYYSSAQGRFITRDIWEGVYTRSLSLNRWIYVEGNLVNYQDPAGNYISPYSKAGIPCPIPGTGGWVPIGCGNSSGSSSSGPKSSNIRTVEYNRAAAIQYAYSHDYNDSVENGIHDWTPRDCTSFVSLSLWAGGVRDTRVDPYILNLNVGKADYDIPYWHKWKAYEINVANQENGGFDESTWINVNYLFDFLTKVLLFRSYLKEGGIPRFHNDPDDNYNSEEWLNFLKNTPILPGDVVQYMVEGEWEHTAMIVNGSDSQTFYEMEDPFPHKPVNCDILPNKPRVVDRSGQIKYITSRSIDNTGLNDYGHGVSAIRIIHIPDILKVRYVY